MYLLFPEERDISCDVDLNEHLRIVIVKHCDLHSQTMWVIIIV